MNELTKAEHEERLAALRAQPTRSREDIAEMQMLGADDAEIKEEGRKLDTLRKLLRYLASRRRELLCHE